MTTVGIVPIFSDFPRYILFEKNHANEARTSRVLNAYRIFGGRLLAKLTTNANELELL